MIAGASSLFGNNVGDAGGIDAWVARLDPTGTPRFVQLLASPADDTPDSVLATADGGCLVTVRAGDLAIGGTTLPASGGPAALLHFDATGALVTGVRLPVHLQVVELGGQLYGAFDTSTPVTIAGKTFTPSGIGAGVIALDETGPTALLAVIDGTGNETVAQLASVGPDALAVAVLATGEVQFGTHTVNLGATQYVAIAVLGL